MTHNSSWREKDNESYLNVLLTSLPEGRRQRIEDSGHITLGRGISVTEIPDVKNSRVFRLYACLTSGLP